MNKVILIGRLTQDPDLRFSQGSNQSVARFTVAVDKGYSRDKRDEMARNGKPTADFPRVVVFGRQAENCANYLSKGRMVAIEGSIQTGSYKNQQGNTVYTTEVMANRVEFIEKAPQQQSGYQPAQQQGGYHQPQQSGYQPPQQQSNNGGGFQPPSQYHNNASGDDDFKTFQEISDDEIPF